MNKNIYRYYQNSSRLKHLYKETAWGLPFRGAIRCKQYIYHKTKALWQYLQTLPRRMGRSDGRFEPLRQLKGQYQGKRCFIIGGAPSLNKLDLTKVDEIINSYEGKKTNLIAILQKVQEIYNYLPMEAMTYIGTKMEGLSPATVYGVATFYAQFSLEPKGKYVIKMCDGTACHVRGSMPVYNSVISRFNLKDGKFTTADGMFSVETVSCLGACGLAPVVVINEKVYPKMTTDAMKVILDDIIKQERE